MEQNKEKQLIYFKDLVFSALYQWKKILVVAILFAVLFGALNLLTAEKAVNVGGVNMTPETEKKVSHLEQQRDRYKQLIEQQTYYIDHSPYMQIDPFALYTCGFALYVQPEYDAPITDATPVVRDSNALRQAYRSLITNSSTIDTISASLDMEPAFLRDLLTFDLSTDGMLSIVVYSPSADDGKHISSLLSEIVTNNHDSIAQQLMPHTINIIPTQNGPAINLGIADGQANAHNKLTQYENQLLSYESQLNQYLPTALVSGESDPLPFAIIGGILGAFLMVGIAWVSYLGSSRIYSARVLSNRTGIRVLGCVNGRKRNFIDRWLRKLEGRAVHSSFDTVCADICNRCGDGKQLLVMGCFRAEALQNMTAILEKADIRCTVCADPVSNAEAIAALPTCDAVVLVDTCGSSRYDQVEWAMQTVADYEKNLLGCVLIDG